MLFKKRFFYAEFSLAFHGFFRVGELIVNTSKVLQETILQIDDLACDHDTQSLLMTIRYSKTNQLGKGTVLQIDGQGGVACPYRLVSYYISVRPGDSEPLFCHFDLPPLTRYQLTVQGN